MCRPGRGPRARRRACRRRRADAAGSGRPGRHERALALDDRLPAGGHAADRLEGLRAVVADGEAPLGGDDQAVAGRELLALAVELHARAAAQGDEGLVAGERVLGAGRARRQQHAPGAHGVAPAAGRGQAGDLDAVLSEARRILLPDDGHACGSLRSMWATIVDNLPWLTNLIWPSSSWPLTAA